VLSANSCIKKDPSGKSFANSLPIALDVAKVLALLSLTIKSDSPPSDRGQKQALDPRQIRSKNRTETKPSPQIANTGI
jgi:hypothetical protein